MRMLLECLQAPDEAMSEPEEAFELPDGAGQKPDPPAPNIPNQHANKQEMSKVRSVILCILAV